MDAIGWGIALFVFAAIEGLTAGLTSVWFAVGALGAIAVSALGGDLWLQIVVFLLLSALSLLALRPLAQRLLKPSYTATNADMVLGQTAVVTETVDNLTGRGAVSVSGQVWSARSADPEQVLSTGQQVRILSIQGVKVMVEPLEPSK